eukprot:TRINITY_DN5172_c0_g1_i2.p1 TRINITY_DN5172_c0_g1~~TRINITY_DN5172_c0_g1_i2.p1  ORF type:complete len:464 (-),score=79.58 TRINITY_DN5172_c0_g1_i2:1743-3101(-)
MKNIAVIGIFFVCTFAAVVAAVGTRVSADVSVIAQVKAVLWKLLWVYAGLQLIKYIIRRPAIRKLLRLKSREKMTNPFVSNTRIDIVEKVKIVIMSILLVPVIRIVLCLLIACAGALWARLVMIGAKTDHPLPKWRRVLLWPLALFVRLLMFVLGFWFVRVKYHKGYDMNAPVIVVNHTSMFDALWFLYRHLPMVVCKEGVGKVPIIGPVMRALQAVYVPRGMGAAGAAARAAVGDDIVKRTQCGLYPPLLIFPEGTTTSGQALITFKPGAFKPGLPVQPVSISFPYQNVDISWSPNTSTYTVLYRLLCQFANFMTVEYLPCYYPNPDEKKNADLFATNVRARMAAVRGCPVTRHSVDDVMLANKAQSEHVVLPEGTRMLDFQEQLRAGLTSVGELLHSFREMDKSGDSVVRKKLFLFCFLPLVNHVFVLTECLFPRNRLMLRSLQLVLDFR